MHVAMLPLLSNLQTNSFFRQGKDFLTRGVFQTYTTPETITQAIKLRDQGKQLSKPENKPENFKDKILAKIKIGHIISLALASILPFLKSFLKDSQDPVSQFLNKYSFSGILAAIGSFTVASFVKNPAEANLYDSM